MILAQPEEKEKRQWVPFRNSSLGLAGKIALIYGGLKASAIGEIGINWKSPGLDSGASRNRSSSGANCCNVFDEDDDDESVGSVFVVGRMVGEIFESKKSQR